MPLPEIAPNDLSDPDPTRAAEFEQAIWRALAPFGGEIECSLFLVGFPRDLLRIELRGPDWCENLPLLPRDIPARTVATLAQGVVERRHRPRPTGN
jgi:hypothetical protein